MNGMRKIRGECMAEGMRYCLETAEPRSLGSGDNLRQIKAAIESIGIKPVNGAARYYPGSYAFESGRPITSQEEKTILQSIREQGLGEYVFK